MTIGVDNMTSKVQLKRSVGLVGGTSMILGLMIGSGIFISPKNVLEGSGSVGLCILLWIIGGILTLCTGLSYVELGTMFPSSGGEYVYILEGSRPVLAFLNSYARSFVLKPASIGIMSLTCARYILAQFHSKGCGPPTHGHVQILATFVLITVCLFNCMSAKAATKILTLITSIKVIALMIIVLGGIYNLWNGSTEYIQRGFDGTNTNAGEISLGFLSVMYAYSGCSNLNSALDELKDPPRNLPLAMFIALPLVAILNVFTNISYLTVLSPGQLLNAPAVSIAWAEGFMPKFAWVMPLCVSLSTMGSIHAHLFSSGRLLYAAGKEGHAVKSMCMIHVMKCVPIPAVIFTTIISFIMITLLDVYSLIRMYGFIDWTIYVLVFAILLHMRYTRPNTNRPYKVPLICPVVALTVSIAILVLPIVFSPRIEILYCLCFLLYGLLLYVIFIKFRWEIPGIRTLNIWIQLLMQVCPPDVSDGKTTAKHMPNA